MAHSLKENKIHLKSFKAESMERASTNYHIIPTDEHWCGQTRDEKSHIRFCETEISSDQCFSKHSLTSAQVQASEAPPEDTILQIDFEQAEDLMASVYCNDCAQNADTLSVTSASSHKECYQLEMLGEGVTNTHVAGRGLNYLPITHSKLCNSTGYKMTTKEASVHNINKEKLNQLSVILSVMIPICCLLGISLFLAYMLSCDD